MSDLEKRRRLNPGDAARNVLVIKLSALGDFVMALGAMKAVRAHHPSARITLLTTPVFKDFATLCPYVDAVETDGRPKGVTATRDLIARLRKARYDIIYDFQTSNRTANYFKALNAFGRRTPLWSGHAPRAQLAHDNPDRAHMHPIDRLADQLTYAGAGPPEGWNALTKPMPDLSWVRRNLGDRPSLQPAYFRLEEPYMLLIPGASAHRAAKRWPAERYGALAARIADAGVQPVIIGGTAEGQIAQDIVRAEPRVVNLATRTDLFQIVALAERARFVVGNDTGPMHMSTLAGAPGIALFATSESDPNKAAPRGATVIVVHGDSLEDVDVDTVWSSILALGRLPERGPA